jgi:hypothetical protein
MAPIAAVHAVHAVHAMTGKIKTLKLTKSRLSAASIDKLAACAARARIRDIAMLLCKCTFPTHILPHVSKRSKSN